MLGALLAPAAPLLAPAAAAAGAATLVTDPYVQGLTIDGTESSLAYLPAADVSPGTTLDFSLGGSADTSWGSAAADAPPSYGGTPGAGVKQNVGPITETQTVKCVDDRRSGTSNGTGAQQWDRSSAGELVNPQSGLCLTDASNGATNSTQLDIAACTGAVGQLWTLPAS
jgi:hypothetical protein